MGTSALTPAAAGALAVLRATASPITTDELRQQAGLDYESSLDALAELMDRDLVEIDGNADMEFVFIAAKGGA